jgi:hypothetical protein
MNIFVGHGRPLIIKTTYRTTPKINLRYEKTNADSIAGLFFYVDGISPGEMGFAQVCGLCNYKCYICKAGRYPEKTRGYFT